MDVGENYATNIQAAVKLISWNSKGQPTTIYGTLHYPGNWW
jgi:hypothetical protein